MKTNILNLRPGLAALVILTAFELRHATVIAQGTTAFTYQGRLVVGESPANGNYLMYFAMFNTNFGGPLLFGITNTVPVTNGLFVQTLDFGSGMFDGSPRWLEVGVSTNGPSAFTSLVPRQQITPTPYAIFAATAGALQSGSISSSQIAGGQVVKSLNGLKDDVQLVPGTNITLSNLSNSNILISASGGSGVFSLNGTNAYYNSGHVGIGTTTPADPLEVVTGLRKVGLNTAIAGINAGGIASFSNPSSGNKPLLVGVSASPNEDCVVFGSGGGTEMRLVSGGLSSAGFGFYLNMLPSTAFASARPTPAMKIDGAGNVGIGTASPGAPLDIQNSSQANARIVSGNTPNGSVLELWNTTSPDGHCGPDTPNQLLYGAINFGDGNSTPGQIAYDGCVDEMTFRVGLSPQVYFQSGGVGIGRRAIANRLEVEGNASKTTAGNWLANSDARIKTDTQTLTGACDKLNQLRFVSFRYNEDYRKAHPGIEDHSYFNVIAQEFQNVFPDWVKGSGERLENGDEILQVDTYPLTIYSAAAIQELHRQALAKEKEIMQLHEKLTAQKTFTSHLEARLKELEKLVSKGQVKAQDKLEVTQQSQEDQ